MDRPDERNGEESQTVPKCPTAKSLTARQRAAMELILCGQTDSAIAAKLGINRRTLYRWRTKNTQFAAELRQRHAQVWDGANDRLRRMLRPAIRVLSQDLKNPDAIDRHRAACSILRLTKIADGVAC
jgi:transposase-like protein